MVEEALQLCGWARQRITETPRPSAAQSPQILGEDDGQEPMKAPFAPQGRSSPLTTARAIG